MPSEIDGQRNRRMAGQTRPNQLLLSIVYILYGHS